MVSGFHPDALLLNPPFLLVMVHEFCTLGHSQNLWIKKIPLIY